MTCLYCGHFFEGKRADAKFCSVKCRVAYSRNAQAVTAIRNTEPVTDTDPLPTDPAELLAPRLDGEPLKEYHCPDCGCRFMARNVVFEGPLYRFSVEAKGFVEVTD